MPFVRSTVNNSAKHIHSVVYHIMNMTIGFCVSKLLLTQICELLHLKSHARYEVDITGYAAKNKREGHNSLD